MKIPIDNSLIPRCEKSYRELIESLNGIKRNVESARKFKKGKLNAQQMQDTVSLRSQIINLSTLLKSRVYQELAVAYSYNKEVETDIEEEPGRFRTIGIFDLVVETKANLQANYKSYFYPFLMKWGNSTIESNPSGFLEHADKISNVLNDQYKKDSALFKEYLAIPAMTDLITASSSSTKIEDELNVEIEILG